MADPSKVSMASITVTSTFSLSVSGPSSLTAGGVADYTATLTPAANSNPSRLMSWSVTGTGCTGIACGTISASGAYTAPPLLPSPPLVQITATPQADPSKAASFAVTILPVISVSISPSPAAVGLGASQVFQAAVSGVQDQTVTWDVNGVVGGSVADGLILNSQIAPDTTTYTAPLVSPPRGSVTVHARSNAVPSVSAGVTVTLTTAVNLTVLPGNATLALNERQTFAAQVNNTTNQSVAWLVNGIPGGNFSAGMICATGSSPCQPVSGSTPGSVDYVAPAGVPSPNPVTITAVSQTAGAASASANVTILPHIVVSVQPGNAAIAELGTAGFTASVTGSKNQIVIWNVTGAGCGTSGACGFIDSTGVYTAPAAPPSPNSIDIVATSSEDVTQSGTSAITITNGPAIFSFAPTSAYAGSAGEFTLLVSGNNFTASSPGPASILLVAGSARPTICASNLQCITALTAADLQIAGNLSVQLQNPDGKLSNTESFVVLAPGTQTGVITLTPGNPTSTGDDIVVVDLSTNGGTGPSGNVSLNVAAVGTYNVATTVCGIGGSPVVIQRPTTGTGTADLCVFSVSALDPSFTYTVSGPPTPDITVINREPLGLGLIHLTLQVPSTAAPGPRTLFVENPEKDMAAGTGAIEVQ